MNKLYYFDINGKGINSFKGANGWQSLKKKKLLKN